MTHTTPRPTSARLWSSLALATAIGGLAATGASAETAHANHAAHADHGAETLWLAAGEGGEGGEGGEAGGDSAEMSVKDMDAAYLTALSLIEGHLRSGIALYRDGQTEMAQTHMKHPEDEIYTDLEHDLDERGATGFSDELAALADTVNSGAPVEAADAAFEAVLDRIAQARTMVSEPAAAFASLEQVLRVAAEEYEIGIVDGEIANLHEYQDAHGFTETVRAQATSLAGSEIGSEAEAAATVLEALDGVAPAFAKGLVPEGALGAEADARLIHGAAARTELAVLSVK